MRLFLVPIQVETESKNTLNQKMIYTSLNFRIYVTDFDPASYWLASTLLLFRNSTPVPLFLFWVGIAHCPAIPNTISFGSTVLAKIGLLLLKVHFLILVGSFERKTTVKIGGQ